MTEPDLDRLRAAYPALPDDLPPPATVARLHRLYATEAPQPARRSWWPRRGLALLGVGAVAISGTALAANPGGWRPQLGSPDRPAPRAAKGTVPADQLAALSILRRPQTQADRGPLVRDGLAVLSRDIVNGILVDDIRVVSEGPRDIVVLIPVRRTGNPAVAREHIGRDVLCLLSSLGPRSGWGQTCGTTETLQTVGLRAATSIGPGDGLFRSGQDIRTATLRNVIVVPDGVARVRVRLRGDRRVDVPIRGNVGTYVARGLQPAWGTQWFDAQGRRLSHARRP